MTWKCQENETKSLEGDSYLLFAAGVSVYGRSQITTRRYTTVACLPLHDGIEVGF